jgi:protoporphyrinogen IX oxidase
VTDWLDYNWLRAGHIIAVIAWMAGMLMYPRLLVYRLEAEGNAPFEAAMDLAADRLRRIILTPSIVLMWLLGGLLIWKGWGAYQDDLWFWGKIAIVTGLSAMHGVMVGWGRKVARGERPVTSRQLRMVNEIPMVGAIVVVILVVVEPFV